MRTTLEKLKKREKTLSSSFNISKTQTSLSPSLLPNSFATAFTQSLKNSFASSLPSLSSLLSLILALSLSPSRLATCPHSHPSFAVVIQRGSSYVSLEAKPNYTSFEISYMSYGLNYTSYMSFRSQTTYLFEVIPFVYKLPKASRDF
ncbi:hypothetical protein TorRG33x02_329360 [Trema orientale]|uniref:Uncharacterized protein n=1 Tax=Trema orientale TaxID=63057 RepID=A0A2P5B8T0_TREOI|nr:hypothetical protein TorRG33x02_329360 [Trema orientale]